MILKSLTFVNEMSVFTQFFVNLTKIRIVRLQNSPNLNQFKTILTVFAYVIRHIICSNNFNDLKHRAQMEKAKLMPATTVI